MIHINTNVPSLVAARILTTQDMRLSQSMIRLGTGLRINSGKDDPAGLIASEVLRSEKTAINAAINNIARANNVVASAESGLNEIGKLILDLEELVDKSANESGISDDERDANQLQIDAILESITRIANTTEFQGRKLLSGELDYATSAIDTSDFEHVQINAAKLPTNSYRTAIVEVTTSAQLAQLVYGASTTGAGLTTIEITGGEGSESLTFTSNTVIATVATAINQSREMTGVSASVFSATGLRFSSIEYGSEEFVTVQTLAGTFNVTGGDAGSNKDYGRDATVRVNGVTAVSHGLSARLQTSTLALELVLTTTFGTTPGSSTFYITDGGANFMICPTVSPPGEVSIGVAAVSSSSLGKGGVGYLNSLGSGQTNSIDSKHFDTAQKIIRLAQTQVSQLRGRLGAFQKNVLEPNSNSLHIIYENITAAESNIRETDFAQETSNLTRGQILVQASMAVLRIANAQPQQVLALLG